MGTISKIPVAETHPNAVAGAARRVAQVVIGMGVQIVILFLAADHFRLLPNWMHF